ncbi:Phage-related baseplate assembly protein [Pseudomonas sp. ok272]|uniref:baseplate assembly protein n=1 Tax=unclassified Pseudomonas TaxID=196821 RepID=UPI0008AEB8E0|nr:MULTISPECIES: baseplate J/gp47 family protein [unclassified Pseudomonas]SEN18830.1 Phage-related baseplate assembly protein [Pseudomonas sp. ok272]SFN10811.1 Phage-related baseplate assembly protein [Pseudomonas sp. ok602]
MSTVDLSALPAPQVLEALDFEALYEEELSTFRQYMGDNWTAPLESDPVVKLLELGAYRRLQNRARVNDAAKALLLAYAEDSDLDQLAANVKLKRLIIQAANGLSVPPTAEVKESDDALRERVQWAYEGLTTAGPRSSYILHARSASALVGDATAESPKPAEVVVTVQDLHGNGQADQALLDTVMNYLSDDDVRPVADRLTVQSTEVLEYRIDAVLHMEGVGSENEAILAEANRRLAAWINPRRRLGIEVARSAIDAQVHLAGVRRVDLPGWVDIVPSKYQSAYCTGFTVIQGA